ncbi:hypothetical protein EAX61_14765 [Dokdonia sinensis]|uniref:Uncharacterized protein n=1 Tax=Dokdonia sinensis TaxID=2479847 RepID=A0A3M0FV22_9FLAO|nr:hypothetical protein [Dokdonia sinensis]RMB56345.1 hypothetical protein EAX61_14765 [Dokdonia sinensis]
MTYPDNFKDLVKLETYIGTGNPNSQILIVGKEVATDIEDGKHKELEVKNLESFNKNNIDWLQNINNNVSQIDIPVWRMENDDNNPLYAFKGASITKEGHTWRKYQKLNDYIFDKISNEVINFQENIFITEMSTLPAKTTGKAQKRAEFKQKLQERKETFFKSSFIQDFSIVVLACSNYISGSEITDIFNVDFIEEKGRGTQKYWIHWNKDKTKIVLHTRQLSANVSNDLLKGIAREVQHFLKN